MAYENSPATSAGATIILPSAADTINAITRSQLEHALDANRRGLRVYESLKSLNDVIGTQYGDRVLFELLQNAHDAHDADEAGEIAVRLIIHGPEQGILLVANKGRAFNESNLEAIRNIGTSDKEIGEGIGNKGLGFRSVEALTDDVQIYSADDTRHSARFGGYCFRFATIDEIATELKLLGASDAVAIKVAASIPRYLIPVAVEYQSDEICQLSKLGYATVVALPLDSAAAIDLARKQVNAVLESSAPVLLFLDRVSSLDVEITTQDEPPDPKRLTRKVTAIAAELPVGMRMERIILDGQADYLVARQILPKVKVLNAVKASISAAPPLKRWLAWKGDAVVSVAVPLDAPVIVTPRLFNFLPMDALAVSPMAGHIDAPFFADIDRRSIKSDLPLNKYLLEAGARAAAQSAMAIVHGETGLPANAVIDLAAWSGLHMPKIFEAFAALGQPLAEAAIWPVVPGGPAKWASFSHLYAWPDVRTLQLTPRRLAAVAGTTIVPGSIGDDRLGRLRALAAVAKLPLSPTEDALGGWVEATTEWIWSKHSAPGRWRNFYDDIVTLYTATKLRLSSLEGKKLFVDADGKLLTATAKGLAGAPPVFHRIGKSRGKRNEGPPSPPSSLSRKFRFVSATVEISETSLRALEKAGLLRQYDPLEALNSLKGALGDNPTETQRREALIWAFKVWRSAGGKAVEEALRAAALFVPCLTGWTLASQSSFSASWTQVGRTLEVFLHEAARLSKDANDQKGRLLISFADWPRATPDERREDWLRFLGVIGVRDGLHPIAGVVRRKGTPYNHWNSFLVSTNSKAGLDANWVALARKKSFSHPMTEHDLTGEVWRFPGQIEHAGLPVSAKEALSDLIITYLREHGDEHFTFSIDHWRGFQKVELPTPLQVFLREAPWPASLRRDEILFETPQNSWSTTVGRQAPPRFVPRFWAEPGSRATLPSIMFDEHIALRDWAAPASAPARLASLAGALADMSAAERRDLREQLRRAWHDVAEHRLELPKGLELVVERAGGLELLAADALKRPVVHITTERQGFAARALADRGEAVLDIGEIDGAVVHGLLAATGDFTPRLADSGDVQLQVDGARFEPDLADVSLVSGSLSWLSDVAILAHEYLGDALELRTLPTEELDRRIRQIRLRRCDRFALLIDDQEIVAYGNDRVQAAPHPRVPTLLVTGRDTIDLDLLLEAAPAITKLIGARRNTLEPMLGRLQRDGYCDTSQGPSEDMLARAIHRDIGLVRDHFAATSGGIERRVRALFPVVAFLRDRALADNLLQSHGRLGQALKLRSWLSHEFGPEVADRALAAIEDTDDQAQIRRRMGFDFRGYGRTLAELDYPPLNNETDFRRLFGVFLAELKPDIVDRIRRRFAADWRTGQDLKDYVRLRTLEFIQFDPAWPIDHESIDRDFVSSMADAAADATLGPDDISIILPEFDRTLSTNRKLITSNHALLSSLIRAWCRKASTTLPPLMDMTDPQPLVRALDERGLLDFEPVKARSLPELLAYVDAWPSTMPRTDVLDELMLTEADLQHEEREVREIRRRAEVEKRTIKFGGTPLDTGSDDFATLFEQLADAALTRDPDWYGRSRAPRLAVQEQTGGMRKRTGINNGKGQDWKNQPPDTVRRAMGIASEWLAREYLKRRHPREMSDDCWVSSNRAAFCTGSEGSDSLGYDFRVETMRHEYLYEVKSSLDEGGEFELSARELEVAGSASLERKRRYRILYVPFVFDPMRWHILPLSNPVSEETRNRFRVVRSGSVRYRFDRR
jgi:hypothetical protein